MSILRIAKKFLCIDDDRTMLMVTRQILTKSFGSDVLEFYEAYSGEEGLDKASGIRPDIILSDIQMPGINGFEVCRKIRAQFPQMAIILTSAYDAEQDNATKAKEAGADAYLSKPIKKGELLFIVNFIFRVTHLNETVFEKNRQLEESLEKVKKFHVKLTGLNEELRADKKRLDVNLKDMAELNAQLERKNSQITSMMDELSSRFDSTVSLLSNIIEMNRVEHRGHAERVAKTAVFIAGKMNLTEYQTQNIRVAALLHELGIVGLPKDKKDIALDEEHGRAQSPHPLVGEMLLKSHQGFELIADIIRNQHENVDGSGKPDGLYGDSIPLGSRIIAAASYYDHELLSNPKLGSKGVLAKMQEKSGVVFDETVLSLLEEYLKSGTAGASEAVVDCTVFSLADGMELAADMVTTSGISLLRKGTILSREILTKIMKFNNVDPIVGPIRIKQG